MDLIFRTLGAWGAGKGANLDAGEVDENFWSLAQAIFDLQNDPAQPNGIANIAVSGTQMTITLHDGTVLGPYTLPVLTFRWRGEWVPLAAYAELDVFTVLDTGIFMALLDHTSGATFDPDIAVGGEPALQQLFGSTNAALSGLSDVELTDPGPNDGDVLIWSEDDSAWVNEHLGTMALQDNGAVNITGGAITGMPPPMLPSDVVNKAYVDALPAGMTIDDYRMMANISGVVGPALPHTLSDFLDYALLTSARGTMLYRGSGGWVALPPGTSGYFLKTLGAGADPAWAVGGSGVTSVAAGAGITTGAGPITASGSVALASVADNSFLANIAGSSAAPAAATLTAFLDHVASSTRGAILTRAGSGWVALAPGTSGYYLQTQGSTADPVWSAPSGSGTVTSISAGTGISTGGAPITGAGTVSLATIGTASVLANISGSTAAPVPATVSVLFDSVFGSTQGAVVYRNASTWVMLPPGTSGQVFTTGGAAANPAWANAAAGAPIANLLLLANISGSTAAPAGNSLSNIFDAILGSSRGMLVYRGSAGWVALSPGTTGDVLTTGGTAADPHWAAATGGASISVGDTAPASPSSGDAWWDSIAGQLYIRYNDGTSSQWVPASNQPGPPGPAGTSIPLPVAIASGGTGATTAPLALAALGGAPLASPVFTGDARAVTPATADSDTSIATTAYVQAQGYATSAAMTAADNLRVLKAGDTMTGTLNLSAGVPPLQLNGVSFATFDTNNHYIFDRSASAALILGGTGNAINCYRNTTHNIQSIGGTVTFAVIDNTYAAFGVPISSGAGYRSRSGTGGPFQGNLVNIQWVGPAHLWIDNVDQGAISITCDYRIKDNVAELTSTWDRVKGLRPISYTIKDNAELLRTADPALRWGFLAHELQETLLPTAASGVKDAPNEVQSPDLVAICAALTRALQEAMARIEVLEGKPA